MASDTSTDLNTELTFRSGFVISRSCVRVLVQYEALANMGEPDTSVMEWSGSTLPWRELQAVEWTAIRVSASTTPDFLFYALGNRGDVAVQDSAGNWTEERVDDGPDGTRVAGDLRDLSLAGNDLLACGMGRRVYRRLSSGTWVSEDYGVRQDIGELRVSGFNAIDGISRDDVIAVGFAGEVWRRAKGRWSNLHSPTNLVLHRVRMLGPNRWIAAGQGGVVLLGSGDNCAALHHNETEADFWGLEIFMNQIWLATERALFRLTAEQTLMAARTGLGEQWSYRHLHARDGVMWSFGPRHVAWTADGDLWHDATP